MKSRTFTYAAALCAATMELACAPAQSAVLFVTTTLEGVDVAPGDGVCSAGPAIGCTLRAAIMESNALGGLNTIDVPPGTYSLTLAGPNEDGAAKGDLDIRTDTQLIGSGPFTVIDGVGLDRIFDILPSPTVRLTIGDMTLRDGYAPNADGGAIRNGAALKLRYVAVIDSRADRNGGGIAGRGAARFEIELSAIEGNRSGALDCSIVGDGGGLYAGALSTNVTLDETYVRENVSCRHGGGMYIGSNALLTDVSVAQNLASSANGRGGGVYANSIEMKHVTLETNSAWSGGGLTATKHARMINTTISANRAKVGGGGVDSRGYLSMLHVTLANNSSTDRLVPSAGLVHHGPLPQPLIVNSLFTGNALQNCRLIDAVGAPTPPDPASRNNLDSDDSCGFATVGPGASIVLVPGGVMPLAWSGGIGRTHQLALGSPARDAADLAACPQYDQRWTLRPVGNGCDIGATEQ